MKLKRVVIKRFRSIHELHMDLEDLSVLIGANNSGKSNIIRAIRLIPEGIAYLRDRGYAEISIVEDIDTIWFFKDHREPVIICAMIDLEQRESSVLREISSTFQEIHRVGLELGCRKTGWLRVQIARCQFRVLAWLPIL